MRRVTITIDDDLEASVEAYLRLPDAPELAAVVDAALREYLERRNLKTPVRKLRITPAPKGSGSQDVSRRHDG